MKKKLCKIFIMEIDGVFVQQNHTLDEQVGREVILLKILASARIIFSPKQIFQITETKICG
jgi:hypothetical protein